MLKTSERSFYSTWPCGHLSYVLLIQYIVSKKCKMFSSYGCMVALMVVLIVTLFSVCISLFQIVSAVHYCHQKKIVHRDLKVIDVSSAACFFESSMRLSFMLSCSAYFQVSHDILFLPFYLFSLCLCLSLSFHYHLLGRKPSARCRFQH